jgi:tRNA threonylcarbamoyl adenosine modification protein (Sua5/YciO/YrdC/YwlC family)
MIIEIQPESIDKRLINQAVETLKSGGIIVFPTDTVYAMGCDLYNKKALTKLAKMKDVKLSKANFAIICPDLSHLSEYVKQIDRSTFKLLKHNLPGPFTFILSATNEVQRLFESNRQEIGIRIPNNKIILELASALGNPIATTSLHNNQDEILDYFVDPYAIYEQLDDQVDLIIDGGMGRLEASTVVDCTSGEPVIIRQGEGQLE